MNATLATECFTPDDLSRLPEGEHFELIDGRPVERNMSVESSWIAGEILRLLGNHCYSNKLGLVWPADNGYQCFPGSPNMVRKPDVSFIQANRITPELREQGFANIPPDLAVEIASPNDLFHKVEQKILLFLRAGVRLMWVVIPELQVVRTIGQNRTGNYLQENDQLTGEDVVPGFQCLVRQLFWPSFPVGNPTS